MKAVGTSHTTASQCETAAQRQAALHLAKLSRCPRDHWHAAIEARLASPSMTMLVVGANKGYGVLELLQRYTATNLSGVDWQQQLQSGHAKCGRCCGICNDCRASLTRGLLPHAQRAMTTVRVHAFEVLPTNVAMLRAVTARFGLHAQVEVHARAVSNSSADMELGGHNGWRNSNHPGYECAMPSFRSAAARQAPAGPAARQKRVQKRVGGTIALQAITIDAFVAARRVDRVHVLEVDANGMDALVLEGAAQMLAARRIDVVAFEYHGIGFYGTCGECRSLRGMLVRLEGLGYACYWQGAHGGVARASGRCWQDTFEFWGWSNLVCTHRADLRQVLERMPMGRPPRGFVQAIAAAPSEAESSAGDGDRAAVTRNRAAQRQATASH